MNVKIIRGKILLVMTVLSVWHEWNKSASWNKVNTVRYMIAICLDLPVLGRVDIVIGVLFAMFCSKWCTMLAKFVGINQVKVVAFMTFMTFMSKQTNESKSFLKRPNCLSVRVPLRCFEEAFSFLHVWRPTFLNTAREVVHRPKNGQICFWYLENSQKLKRAVYNAGNKCSE